MDAKTRGNLIVALVSAIMVGLVAWRMTAGG